MSPGGNFPPALDPRPLMTFTQSLTTSRLHNIGRRTRTRYHHDITFAIPPNLSRSGFRITAPHGTQFFQISHSSIHFCQEQQPDQYTQTITHNITQRHSTISKSYIKARIIIIIIMTTTTMAINPDGSSRKDIFKSPTTILAVGAALDHLLKCDWGCSNVGQVLNDQDADTLRLAYRHHNNQDKINERNRRVIATTTYYAATEGTTTANEGTIISNNGDHDRDDIRIIGPSPSDRTRRSIVGPSPSDRARTRQAIIDSIRYDSRRTVVQRRGRMLKKMIDTTMMGMTTKNSSPPLNSNHKQGQQRSVANEENNSKMASF